MRKWTNIAMIATEARLMMVRRDKVRPNGRELCRSATRRGAVSARARSQADASASGQDAY